MMWSASSKLALALALLCAGVALPGAQAAETQSPPAMSKTQLVIKLATGETVAVRSRFQPHPPAILVEFPEGRVTGMLPERSAIQRGVVEEIHTLYSASKPGQRRWVRGLKVLLRGPYDYDVRAERGRIVIEIAHPAAIGREELELGMTGGAIISGAMPLALSERFQAMQEALNRARPQPWVWKAGAAPAGAEAPSILVGQLLPLTLPRNTSHAVAAVRRPATKGGAPVRADELTIWMWVLGVLGFAGFAGTWWLWARRMRWIRVSRQPAPSVSSSLQIIDQLAWRAFERQGYQLLHVVELGEPLGLMRIAVKDGAKTALLCVGNGTFFEKAAVEEFLRSMRKAQAEQGVLIAPGSFTMPAQRCAKEHHVTLIGREQLTQLLSDGAVSEYYVQQVQQLHKQVEDTQEALRESNTQLDAMRRQRNEASWLLGEERAKSATLDGRAQELTSQLADATAMAAQLHEAAEASRKQWEESQWYLGEARTGAQHLDEQLRSLHEQHQQLQERSRALAQQVEQLARQRDEANWYLAEERSRRQASPAEAPEPEAMPPVADAAERRRAPRRFYPDITVEILQPDGSRIFEGIPRNISRTGLGFESDELYFDQTADRVHVRLYLPDSPAPIEAAARVVWQQQPEQVNGARRQTGCELLDLPEEGRSLFEAILAKSSS